MYVDQVYRQGNGQCQNQPPAPPVQSRRTFLRQLVLIGLVGSGGMGLLAACNAKPQTDATAAQSVPANKPEDAGTITAATCAGYADLTTQEQKVRQGLAYHDQSAQPNQWCHNCHFYQKPRADASCGGCQIVKGPVAPAGHCNAWAA